MSLGENTILLNDGHKMPLLGLGVYKADAGTEVEQAIQDAVCSGYRLIDTASVYKNEDGVGRGLKALDVPREELFITTKIWVTDMKTEETAYEAVKASLKRLNMDYADLILLHQPMSDYFAAYRGLTKACKEGLTKAIGVANFYPAILTNLCETVGITYTPV